jgi:serine/threonine protein kinase
MESGQVIGGRYQCVALIGRGGMGEVWRAHDPLLHRDVAIKVLTYADNSQDADSVSRALREARLAARLNHPNAVTIYDVVTDDGLPCLVMELIEGESFKDLVARGGALPPSFVARVGRQIAGALDRAHRAGIVHRDIKPANVLIRADGTAKLTDFGIARDERDNSRTSTGTFIGTPSFLAPEVALGRSHGPASDLWALGAVLFYGVEGRPPFAAPGAGPLVLLNLIATTDAPEALHGGPLRPVIAALMSRDPAARPDARGLAELLDPTRLGTPTQLGPPTQLGAVTPAAPPARSAPPAAEPPSGRRRRRGAYLIGAALVVAAAVVVTLIATHRSHPVADPTPTPTSSERTTTAPTRPPPVSPTPTRATLTGGAGCPDERTDAFGPALAYVNAVGTNDLAHAQDCTATGTVPTATTQKLLGQTFTPQGLDETGSADHGSSGRYLFTSSAGTRIQITATRAADGHYLVTSVATG